MRRSVQHRSLQEFEKIPEILVAVKPMPRSTDSLEICGPSEKSKMECAYEKSLEYMYQDDPKQAKSRCFEDYLRLATSQARR